MVGLKNSRSAQDEKLVDCIFATHLSSDTGYAPPVNPLSPVPITTPTPVYGATSTNLIIDARPTTNAMANVAMGAGTENMENYKGGKKAYLGIDNIHVMRNSLKMIAEALREAEMASAPIDRGSLRKSNWLRHISAILDGALVVVRNVHLNASHVLVHCSDGWDRTAQLSAIAQICLDPYFRTLEGFKVLVEKDWLAFGHKFLDRSGHLLSEKQFTVSDVPDDDSEDENFGAQKAAQAFFASMQKQFSSNSHLKEIAPVFHQFLDCVRQIQRQYPERFEFSEDYLLDIHYHLYSCQFGTFLFNNERDRRTPVSGKAYIDRTISAWDFLEGPSQKAKYLNEVYKPSLDDRNSRQADADQGVLIPDPKDVQFWHRLFKRGDEEMNGSKLTLLQQATGAELLGPIGAGQVDPISVEGVVEQLTGPLQVPYVPRSRGPSPVSFESGTVTGHTGAKDDHSLPQTSAPGSSAPIMPATVIGDGSKSAVNRLSRGSQVSGSGWGWSQIGSGALSAIQGAAREIKTISAEAMNQMRAEAGEVQGEMWTAGDRRPPGTGNIEGQGDVRKDIPEISQPRPSVRIPSETNPWSTKTELSTRIPSMEIHSTAKSQAVSQADSGLKRYANWNRNPWGSVGPNSTEARTTSSPLASLGDLSLRGDRKSVAMDEGARVENLGKEELEAAMGGDQRAWDPLGAS